MLAAVDEILAAQNLSRSPVAYLGALMTSLQAQNASDPSVYAAVLALLDRCLERVPRTLLLSKAPRISAALVGVRSSLLTARRFSHGASP